MPMKEFDCAKCGHVTESLIRNQQDRDETVCAECGSTELTEKTLYASGAYFIKGDNGASARPRFAKSNERKK